MSTSRNRADSIGCLLEPSYVMILVSSMGATLTPEVDPVHRELTERTPCTLFHTLWIEAKTSLCWLFFRPAIWA